MHTAHRKFKYHNCYSNSRHTTLATTFSECLGVPNVEFRVKHKAHNYSITNQIDESRAENLQTTDKWLLSWFEFVVYSQVLALPILQMSIYIYNQFMEVAPLLITIHTLKAVEGSFK